MSTLHPSPNLPLPTLIYARTQLAYTCVHIHIYAIYRAPGMDTINTEMNEIGPLPMALYLMEHTIFWGEGTGSNNDV